MFIKCTSSLIKRDPSKHHDTGSRHEQGHPAPDTGSSSSAIIIIGFISILGNIQKG